MSDRCIVLTTERGRGRLRYQWARVCLHGAFLFLTVCIALAPTSLALRMAILPWMIAAYSYAVLQLPRCGGTWTISDESVRFDSSSGERVTIEWKDVASVKWSGRGMTIKRGRKAISIPAFENWSKNWPEWPAAQHLIAERLRDLFPAQQASVSWPWVAGPATAILMAPLLVAMALGANGIGIAGLNPGETLLTAGVTVLLSCGLGRRCLMRGHGRSMGREGRGGLKSRDNPGRTIGGGSDTGR